MKKALFFIAGIQMAWPAVGNIEDTIKTRIPDTVWVGIYITSIHDIDFREMEYTVSYWLWLKTTNTELDYLHTLEVPNAKSSDTSFLEIKKTDSGVSMLVKMQSVMKDSWRIMSFPFDRQRLWLTIENSYYPSDSVVFRVDTIGEVYDSSYLSWSMRGWSIDSCRVDVRTRGYRTAFGDPIDPPVTCYSQFRVVIDISRSQPLLLFIKIFLGMYIAFFIACICFYIQPANYDSRFQLSVGATFATIGNKYIVESALPESTSFTLVDSLHALTLVFILLTIWATIVSLRKVHRQQDRSAFVFDKLAAEVILLGYFIGNILLIVLLRFLAQPTARSLNAPGLCG